MITDAEGIKRTFDCPSQMCFILSASVTEALLCYDFLFVLILSHWPYLPVLRSTRAGVAPLLQDGSGRGWRFAVLRHYPLWANIKLLSTVAMPCVKTKYDFTFVPWTSFAVCPRLSRGHESKADIRGYTISFAVEKCSRFADKQMGPGVISEICEYEQYGGRLVGEPQWRTRT